jgi:hypothetical protein
MKERDTIYHRGGKPRDDIHLTPDVSYITNPDVAHEHTDVSVKPIAWFVVALFIFGVVVSVLMWALFGYFDKRERAIEPPASPLARRGEERLPPEPRLQLAPGFEVKTDDGKKIDLSVTGAQADLKVPQAEYWLVRQEWERQLKGYGWADESAGQVRIPIEEAMKLMLKREQEKAQGAPPAQTPQGQQQSTPESGAGETIPAASSSGKTLEKKNQ